MNSTVNEITKSITGKTALNNCTVDELRQITGQYPYFGSLQFLYTKKLKEENSFLLQEQIEKASLYFQNPVWLHSLLNEPIPADGINTEETTALPARETQMESPATFEEVVDQTRVQQDDELITIREQPFINEALESEEKPLPQFKFQPIDPGKAAMTFEPYHTVDYFASQGIKVKAEEEKPKDQFSRQLKSFTEWLKAMKRLPASEIAVNVNPADEKKVEQMAQVSISDREVVTESMAEVWEKQGNHEKARETYEKLSLLNPDKSSYFAAKIEHLKNL